MRLAAGVPVVGFFPKGLRGRATSLTAAFLGAAFLATLGAAFLGAAFFATGLAGVLLSSSRFLVSHLEERAGFFAALGVGEVDLGPTFDVRGFGAGEVDLFGVDLGPTFDVWGLILTFGARSSAGSLSSPFRV